jgi:hypothetical protein
VKVAETTLTPELAKLLLERVHTNQRKVLHYKVGEYCAAIRRGDWVLIPDPIMVTPDGWLINGLHRCKAVVQTNISIPVMICWDAPAEIFDRIDNVLPRSTGQFVREPNANVRGAATRVMLWYERDFGAELSGNRPHYDLHRMLQAAGDHKEAFDACAALAVASYERTGLSPSLTLAVYAIAYENGYGPQVREFAEEIVHPEFTESNYPARVLGARYSRVASRNSRRPYSEAWKALVIALNAHILGKRMLRLTLGQTMPRVVGGLALPKGQAKAGYGWSPTTERWAASGK